MSPAFFCLLIHYKKIEENSAAVRKLLLTLSDCQNSNTGNNFCATAVMWHWVAGFCYNTGGAGRRSKPWLGFSSTLRLGTVVRRLKIIPQLGKPLASPGGGYKIITRLQKFESLKCFVGEIQKSRNDDSQVLPKSLSLAMQAWLGCDVLYQPYGARYCLNIVIYSVLKIYWPMQQSTNEILAFLEANSIMNFKLCKYNNKPFMSFILIQTMRNNPFSSMVRPQDFLVDQLSTCWPFQITHPFLYPFIQRYKLFHCPIDLSFLKLEFTILDNFEHTSAPIFKPLCFDQPNPPLSVLGWPHDRLRLVGLSASSWLLQASLSLWSSRGFLLFLGAFFIFPIAFYDSGFAFLGLYASHISFDRCYNCCNLSSVAHRLFFDGFVCIFEVIYYLLHILHYKIKYKPCIYIYFCSCFLICLFFLDKHIFCKVVSLRDPGSVRVCKWIGLLSVVIGMKLGGINYGGKDGLQHKIIASPFGVEKNCYSENPKVAFIVFFFPNFFLNLLLTCLSHINICGIHLCSEIKQAMWQIIYSVNLSRLCGRTLLILPGASHTPCYAALRNSYFHKDLINQILTRPFWISSSDFAWFLLSLTQKSHEFPCIASGMPFPSTHLVMLKFWLLNSGLQTRQIRRRAETLKESLDWNRVSWRGLQDHNRYYWNKLFANAVVFHLHYNAKSTLHRYDDSIFTSTRHSLQEEEGNHVVVYTVDRLYYYNKRETGYSEGEYLLSNEVMLLLCIIVLEEQKEGIGIQFFLFYSVGLVLFVNCFRLSLRNSIAIKSVTVSIIQLKLLCATVTLHIPAQVTQQYIQVTQSYSHIRSGQWSVCCLECISLTTGPFFFSLFVIPPTDCVLELVAPLWKMDILAWKKHKTSHKFRRRVSPPCDCSNCYMTSLHGRDSVSLYATNLVFKGTGLILSGLINSLFSTFNREGNPAFKFYSYREYFRVSEETYLDESHRGRFNNLGIWDPVAPKELWESPQKYSEPTVAVWIMVEVITSSKNSNQSCWYLFLENPGELTIKIRSKGYPRIRISPYVKVPQLGYNILEYSLGSVLKLRPINDHQMTSDIRTELNQFSSLMPPVIRCLLIVPGVCASRLWYYTCKIQKIGIKIKYNDGTYKGKTKNGKNCRMILQHIRKWEITIKVRDLMDHHYLGHISYGNIISTTDLLAVSLAFAAHYPEGQAVLAHYPEEKVVLVAEFWTLANSKQGIKETSDHHIKIFLKNKKQSKPAVVIVEDVIPVEGNIS
ncbi:hypothetical protein VP01_2856g1 [Puccinia sorghi]|uniref:Uncharacterized protein n=1 Tax=Puccinia sorghi TaxID=27349 RepID=A0A0L6V1Z2_9BASI|nr:hypothetical protein VP01_2856g1 [Puccinia sorghi]